MPGQEPVPPKSIGEKHRCQIEAQNLGPQWQTPLQQREDGRKQQHGAKNGEMRESEELEI